MGDQLHNNSPIESNRLRLRRWEKRDLEPFQRINADLKVMEFYPSLMSPQESDAIVERAMMHFDRHGFGLYAVELKSKGKFIGFVGLQHFTYETKFAPAIEIGWRIASDYWNQGFATEAAEAILKFAFEELRLPEVIAVTYIGNHRSRRVMEKLKMTYDANGDFDHLHPSLINSVLKPHVLYRIRRET